MTRSATANVSETLSLELSRTFPTSCEELYRCFTDADRVAQWFGPKTVTCKEATLDCRPNGRYRIVMAGSDDSHVVVGRFLELDPPRMLRMTWAWESRPEIETVVDRPVRADRRRRPSDPDARALCHRRGQARAHRGVGELVRMSRRRRRHVGVAEAAPRSSRSTRAGATSSSRSPRCTAAAPLPRRRCA